MKLWRRRKLYEALEKRTSSEIKCILIIISEAKVSIIREAGGLIIRGEECLYETSKRENSSDIKRVLSEKRALKKKLSAEKEKEALVKNNASQKKSPLSRLTSFTSTSTSDAGSATITTTTSTTTTSSS